MSRVGRIACVVLLACAASALAQTDAAVPLTSPDQSTSTLPRLVKFTGRLAEAQGTVTITFALYKEQTGETPVWSEIQEVSLDANGRYAVYLGATTPEGIPLDVFASGEARWLGIEAAGYPDQPRVMLVSVPYALAAGDAQTLGGRPASAYLQAPTDATNAAPATSSSSVWPQPATALPNLVLDRACTANYVPRMTSPTQMTNSSLYQNGVRLGLNTTTPFDMLHVRFSDAGGGTTGLAVQNLSSSATSYSGMLFYDHTGALAQFQGFNNSTHEYRINNIASGGTINFMLGSNSKFKVDSTSVRVPGMLRIGSETGTEEPPYVTDGYTGLVQRRLTSLGTSAGQVVAKTDRVALERDGTTSGLRVTTNSTYHVTVVCMGMNSAGASVNKRLDVVTAGTSALYTNAENIVYMRCSIGNAYGSGHHADVTLFRWSGDYYWIGTLTSTYNQ